MRTSSRAIVVKDDSLLVMHRNKFGKQFYALVGGAVDDGETPEEALHRELEEEACLAIANPRLVIIEDAGPKFGLQYIYLCEYSGGEPKLSPDSEEARAHALGQNLYEPMWLAIEELPAVDFLPPELQQTLVTGLHDGFPDQPIELKIADK